MAKNLLDMDNIEKVRAEIERIKQPRGNFPVSKYIDGFNDALECVLSFIDSLQDEPKNATTTKENTTSSISENDTTSASLAEEINAIHERYPEVSFAKLSRICVRIANWQKEQIGKELLGFARPDLTRDKIDKVYDYLQHHAYECGREDMKMDMMKEAIERVVKIDAGGYPYIDCKIELYDYDKDEPLAKEGEKVKLVVIKQ